jgi:hypothetical protein
MTRLQILVIFLLGYLMLSAGLVWEFQQYGLIGSGAVLATLAMVGVDVRGGGSE